MCLLLEKTILIIIMIACSASAVLSFYFELILHVKSGV